MQLVLCVFVVVTLFSSQVIALSGYNKNTRRGLTEYLPKLVKQFEYKVNDSCNCHAARNDYTYRYYDVVRDIDPAYHYQVLADNTTEWYCGLCVGTYSQPYYLYQTKCRCPEALARYTADYAVTSNQWDDYQSKWNVTGRSWHCELCIIDYNVTCVEARIAYSAANPDIGNMDPVFHYITYGYWQPQNYLWPTNLCTAGGVITFPTEYNCTAAGYQYTIKHPAEIWNYTDPFTHYMKNYLSIGWSWGYQACKGSFTTISPYENCWYARFLYWSNYPDVLELKLDPVFHYQTFHSTEKYRVWNGELCAGFSGVPAFYQDCACSSASELYLSMYNIDPSKVDISSPSTVYTNWLFTSGYSGNIWHCELCSDIDLSLNVQPKKLLMQETCVAARNNYLKRNPSVQIAGYDAVAHFEHVGYYAEKFWDSSLCLSSPQYLTDSECANCEPAKIEYANKYSAARLFANPYSHWKLFYLLANTTTSGYVFLCDQLCNLTATTTTITTTTTTTTALANSSLTTTAKQSGTSIPGTASSTTTIGSTTPPTSTTTTATSIGTPSPSATSTSTSTSITSTSTTGVSPVTIAKQSTTTSDFQKSGTDETNNTKLSTTAVLAIVIPIVAVLSVGLGMLFIHQQRRQAVQALIKAEEGERRNYKIDFMSLSIDWLIGSGSFGHVYRGEYRGADVAIKKLKKQNMGNQQLEDLAKEAMVMRPELCIVTEYMPRGNLYDVLHDSSIKLPLSVIRSMALHVAKGLQFIHSAGMIHRDLKSPNLLVDANWTIKIADFGLSCAKSQITDDVQISLLWTAPEILMREKNCYSEKSDVYSLGIILWELMSRQTPFSDFTAAAIPPVIVLGKRPFVQPDWNPTLKVLMAQCWGQLPSHRPLVREVRVTLESINYDSNDGVNAPPSAHSSLNSSHDFELAGRTNFPPRGNVTLIFSDVENSATLWENNPQTMLGALRLYNETCRKLLREFNGYEAQTEGDASMLTFSDPVNAVNYCVATQLALLKVAWSDDILKQPCAKQEWSDTGACLYNGLRIRMGVHCGEPHCEQDQISYRTEYFGPVVNLASRVASHAVGGQIVVTSDVYQRLAGSATKLEPCVAEQLGSIQIKGSHDPVVLYQIWPKDLKARSVQPVLDFTAHGGGGGGGSSHGSSSSASSEQERYAWSLRHNERWIINYDDLELDVVIGTGSFGDVFSGTWKGQRVAIKQFMKQKVTEEVLLEMRTESGILSAIEHPNIIRFLGMCIKIPHLCIVTELLDRGSLSTRKSFAVDIARGMEYLHKNNIIHRDVKSPNMLVAADWTIKIADFGFSRVKSENHTMTQCGTVAWTAPEIFLGERYSEKADVYSYSVILWELVFRKKPWQGMNSMKVCHSVENGERLSTQHPPSGTPDFMIRLMEACWLQDHERRPSFTEVLQYLEQQQLK